MSRTFENSPAVRSDTPLLLGLVGPSGSGKTFSALRLAAGIQRVTGGEIFGIDTESGRMKHYAEAFKFQYVPFVAPFSPLDYLAALEHCAKQGAKIIIIDSMSHEHEGPGGVLEQHEQELSRLAGDDWGKRNKMTFLAWAKPKQQRRRFINSLLQLPIHVICCFRAKTKLKIVRGQEPVSRGYQPIAGEEFIYEMTAKFWLHPAANGFPSWESEHDDERAMMKLPEQFKTIFRESVQLSEDIGQRLAEWAAGKSNGKASPLQITELLLQYADCQSAADFKSLEENRRKVWDRLSAADQSQLKSASADAEKRLPAKKGDGELFSGGTTEDQLDALKR